MNESSRPHLFGLLAGLFLAGGLVLCAMVFTSAWLKIHEANAITVTGSARKIVRADLIVWKGSFLTEANTLLEAQQSLKADFAKVEKFLAESGATNFTFQPIVIQEVRGRVRHDKTGNEHEQTFSYRLTQSVEVRAAEMEDVMKLDRECAKLVEQGVLFTTVSPQFIYTKAGEAKVEMLAEATKDARTRAEQIAVQGGGAISSLRSAHMGVFQITPAHSTQTSWDGINDTTSLEKTVTSVVTATFALK